jgi:hypothetical protein
MKSEFFESAPSQACMENGGLGADKISSSFFIPSESSPDSSQIDVMART